MITQVKRGRSAQRKLRAARFPSRAPAVELGCWTSDHADPIYRV